MKKHSKLFRIVVSFMIFTMVVFGTNLSAYADTELSITCPRNLCNNKIKLSGPLLYGETIPSSVPYLGGSTINSNNTLEPTIADVSTDDHLFIAYCPSYSNSHLSRHAMALFRFSHKYVPESYTELTTDITSGGTTYRKNDYHLTIYRCSGSKSVTTTGNTVSQNLADGTLGDGFIDEAGLNTIKTLAGSMACSTVKQEYEHHSLSTGTWTCFDNTYHQRTNTCSECGYTYTVQQSHSFTYSSWREYNQAEQNQLDSSAPNSMSNHVRTKTCSVCGYVGYEYQSHNHVRDFEGYEPSIYDDHSAAIWHYYSVHCSICNHGIITYSQHRYNSNQNVYTDISSVKHHVTQNCLDCSYVNGFDENHTFTTICEPVSNTRHKFTSTCICGHTNTSYGDHHDDDGDCYCDDCGYLMTRFSVTVPATLSLVMDKDGKVYTPTNAVITNNSTAAVKVTGINLTPKSGWTVVPYSTNMANEKVDSHKIGLKLRDSQSVLGNTMPVTGNWNISKGSNLPLIYSAVVSATSHPITGSNVLDVTFVIDWRD